MCEMIHVLAPHEFPLMSLISYLRLSHVSSCLGPVGALPSMCPPAGPSIIPGLLSPGPKQLVMAVLLVVSSPLPALPTTRERQGHPLQGDRRGAQGPQAREHQGLGVHPRWMRPGGWWAAPSFELQAGQEQEGPPGLAGPCASPR